MLGKCSLICTNENTFLATVTMVAAFDGSQRSKVATVRQTVVVFLATSTAWQRVATIG
jgi:hypothetical protein